MDETSELSCPENDMMNPALTMTTQVSAILVLSHVFQIFLKPLGQPAPLAQILVRMSPLPSHILNSVYSFSLLFILYVF
ncbi:hypothetical protein Hanom_Chr14g01295691 [Helianthus anomalus]